jgi:phosphoglycolate phosphatase-like HAD superfamily hydrolase
VSATPVRTGVLALDFDGVICDSLEEGLLISWNAHMSAPVRAFVEPGLDAVPPDVVERFTCCRPFTRHVGHWLVPFVIRSIPTTHAEFAARYDELPGSAIEVFADAAGRYRSEVRGAYPRQWLARHSVQPGLGDVVADAYIVTARDGGSVRQILDAHAMGVDEQRIFGSCRDKQGALKSIAVREDLAPADVTLVDDNIENCLAACAAGYGVWWATWGYKTAADEALAVTRGVTAITIDTLREAVAPGARST